MTSIERTAYPQLTEYLSFQELESLYSPTEEEIAFVSPPNSTPSSRLSRLTLLKTQQCLAYFPKLSEVPARIVAYLRDCLDLAPATPLSTAESSLYRHQEAIRQFLNLKAYGDGGEAVLIAAIEDMSQSRNDPVDLINAAIEALIQQRFELPGFSTLDRWAQQIRSRINQEWYSSIARRLSPEEKQAIENLLLAQEGQQPAAFVRILETPGHASLTEVQALKERLLWLNSLADTERLLKDIPLARIKLFAAEAKSLEVGDLQDRLPERRLSLLVCLIHQSKIETRDDMVTIFLKRIRRVHKKAKEKLENIRESQREAAEHLIEVMMKIAYTASHEADDLALGKAVRAIFEEENGAQMVFETCQALSSIHDNNTLPLLWPQYANHSKAINETLANLDLHSTIPKDSLRPALQVLRENRAEKYLPVEAVALDFASQRWRRFVREQVDGKTLINRRKFEVCVMTYLSNQLQAGDMAVAGSEDYADYREQLLSWEECKALLPAYFEAMGFPANPDDFIAALKATLSELAKSVDQNFLSSGQLSFKENRRPVLKRIRKRPKPAGANKLRYHLQKQMPQRTILDALAFADHWLHFTRHFGPMSGSAPKIADEAIRYLMTSFGYGCNLGPEQTARHSRGLFTTRALALTNRQHISSQQLDAAIRDIINYYNRFDLTKYWGSGKTAAADGTVFNTYLNNLMAERHVRYGEYGGVAYHHVSDKYIALFSHFINVGVWEAVYIIDGLLENTSDIQPDTLHADTQGQSLTVFGLAHLLGIQLMPRIRNWKDLTMFRPDEDAEYEHIDSLFTATIDWELIREHWRELMQVVLSIREGRLLPSMILRKLGNFSRQNSLYKAFRELGRVIRTQFLLRFISDESLRRVITATTNKIESFHHFIEWIFFGGHGVITDNDPLEMEKRVKYNDLVAAAIILLNVVDMSQILAQIDREVYTITPETLATLSPYMTKHLQRFGDFVIDLKTLPDLPNLEPIALSVDMPP